MTKTKEIRYLKRSEIDAEKWDRCIKASPNGLVYAYSWYLDGICDNWYALVAGDYEVVMPLPWRKKWGIRYVYTPPFVQQLGIIGQAGPMQENLFLKTLHRCFSYGSYYFNFQNKGCGAERTNFVLDLSDDYFSIAGRYKSDLRKNLIKASRHPLSYQKSADFHAAIRMYFAFYGKQIQTVQKEDFVRFEKMCRKLQPETQLLVREIRSRGGDVLAATLILKAKNRLYLLMASTSDAGRKISATHYLLDQLIREFSGNDLILDFEGSDLPGVFHFYKNFGGVNQPYFFHHWNHLPIPLRWIKK